MRLNESILLVKHSVITIDGIAFRMEGVNIRYWFFHKTNASIMGQVW